MPVKVILRTDVPKLGNAGDIKNVAPGFARNYLIPRGMAEQATEAALAAYKKGEAKRAAASAKALDSAKAQAGKLEGTKLTFSRATAAEGKIFGSVGKNDIAKSLKTAGFEVDRNLIVLETPLKAVGEFDVEIKLHAQASAKIKVSVLARA
jgi:large subunit ribosomal protein L9